ncbi:hypothetical protein Moror_16787 [Moniliophthora roreri MCA 2997]|uniref:Uncharacterized protein n=2 Tax=Moniliophthora roreri TaxID=221103 RepID=V2X7S3_MONRO|nr:hypothetical protein Moror_16787 [Moniliophthora roreri MCA 2997]
MPAWGNQNSVNELLELILQFKKTTPAAPKQVLNSQPQIVYAAMTLQENMNAIDVEVFSKTLTAFAQSQSDTEPSPPAQNTLIPQATPVPAIPSHMQHQSQPYYNRTATPLASTSTPPVATQPPNRYSNGCQPLQSVLYEYGVPPPPTYDYDRGYNQGEFGPVYSGPGAYGDCPPSQASYGTLVPDQQQYRRSKHLNNQYYPRSIRSF